MTRIRRYLLIALLLIIPIQGVAAAAHAFACGADGSAPVAATENGSPRHDHMAAGDHDHTAHQHDQQSGKGAGDHPQHQCCHQVSAVPTVYVSPAPADLPVYLSHPSVLELTFILEQPQRPPRA